LARGFDEIAIDGASVRAGGAVSFPVLARKSASAGLTGLEWAVGVPGSVGGAIRMNAGGHGSDTAHVLVGCRVADLASGVTTDVPVADLAYAYRHSSLSCSQVVVAGTFELQPGNAEESLAQIAEIVRWRREHQPGGANAGSVFRNPPNDSAGNLIDACGLKGLRVGGAVVSPKHANFIQAESGATAADVRGLVAEVQRRVRDATGVTLHPELHFVGFDDPDGGAS
jgi:UDP-N-acetylmuramate dehydrogenase